MPCLRSVGVWATGWRGHRQVISEQEVRGSGTKSHNISQAAWGLGVYGAGTGGQIHGPEFGSATHSLCNLKQVQEFIFLDAYRDTVLAPCQVLNCAPQIYMLKCKPTAPQNVCVFGDPSFKEVIKVK